MRGDVWRKNEGGRYEDIKKRVENGVQTDYGFFEGKVLEMERDVGKYDYAYEKG